ncbi:hypothetical protein C8Q77DRAFT_200052 [Trametes polyzona]|nr:hypothetical protein C8Q77DRAFT_200052 [Trametes polyzona]
MLVVARFNPGQTASRWLSPSGRLAASKIPCSPFWAVRFDFTDVLPDVKNPQAYSPGLLCAISSQPSVIPLEDASLIVGPKHALDTGELSSDVDCSYDVQITVKPPIYCLSSKLHQIVYLHTVPALSTLGRQPVQARIHVLDADSFDRFRSIADRNAELLRHVWISQRKAQLAELLPHHARTDSDPTRWSLFSGTADPTDFPHTLHNPHGYDFVFTYEGDVPFCDDPITIYDEIYLYAQVCKDYSWPSAELVISWVRRIRARVNRRKPTQPKAPKAIGLELGARVPTHVRFQALLQQDEDFGKAFDTLAENERLPRECPGESGTVAGFSTATPSGRSSEYYKIFPLSFAFPLLPYMFVPVPLSPTRPSVVVLDMFGVILDRERAICDALRPWLVFAKPPLVPDEATRLYIEFEALAFREQIASGRATSFPASARTALSSLADSLYIPAPLRTTFLDNVLSGILHPAIFEDVETACQELVSGGIAVVALAPHSPSTLDTLRTIIPRRVLRLIDVYPVAIPMHTPIPRTFFPDLLAWCEQLPDRAIAPGRALTTADVVIASGGVGRVIAPAMGYYDSGPKDVYPTAHVRRPNGIECNVRFYVGPGHKSPTPSVVVDGLAELAHVLIERG